MNSIFRFRTQREELKRLNIWQEIRGTRPQIIPKHIFLFLISLSISLTTVFVLFKTSLSREAVYMTGIFVLAAFLWATEALPLFATAFIIMGLEIILLANPGNWTHLGFETTQSPDYKIFLSPLSNPIIILFLGGFILAQAAVKEGVDKALAAIVLNLFGGKPRMVLLGLMTITAIFSMWMSNTATTAMMITLITPMLLQIPKSDPIRKGLVLCIPFAANIGGMGTPIASPPNAVAVGFLRNEGINIGFLEWMEFGVPIMIGLLIIAWIVLWTIYKPQKKDINLKATKERIDGRGWYVIIIFIVTILLWLTEKIHGIPTAIVALIPAIAFTATGLLMRSDINSLEWNILILIAGGIALGLGMQKTGLDKIIVNLIPVGGNTIIAVLAITTILFSTFMSNTAAANLLLPVGISFAMALAGSDVGMVTNVAIGVALSASLAMALPISTPPNVIAYSKGEIETKDFWLAGGIIGFIGLIVVIIVTSIL